MYNLRKFHLSLDRKSIKTVFALIYEKFTFKQYALDEC